MNCPKCKRELRTWPLKRANLCAPADWRYCIRPVGNVIATERYGARGY